MKFDTEKMQDDVIPGISKVKSNLENAQKLFSELDIPDFTYATLLKDDLEEIDNIITATTNLKTMCEEMIEDFNETECANKDIADNISFNGLTTSSNRYNRIRYGARKIRATCTRK